MEPLLAQHKIQVTSFGGVGTTFLGHFLEQKKLQVAPQEDDAGIWKHMRVPPDTPLHPYLRVRDGFKAIYLFGNPVRAILSVFRRGFHAWHIRRMECDDSPWPAGWVVDYPFVPRWGIRDYVACGNDLYRLEEHFDNWSTCPKEGRSYPILLIRFETLWDHLNELFTFLEIPQIDIKDFPLYSGFKTRLEDYPKNIVHKLTELYAPLTSKIDNFPPIKII